MKTDILLYIKKKKIQLIEGIKFNVGGLGGILNVINNVAQTFLGFGGWNDEMRSMKGKEDLET